MVKINGSAQTNTPSNGGEVQENSVPAQNEPAQDESITEEEVIDAIEKANNKFQDYNTRVEFSIHEKTHEIMVKVYRDDQLIREIPPEKILDMVAKMMEMAGLLVDKKA
jgi:flagellar protein FlaG